MVHQAEDLATIEVDKNKHYLEAEFIISSQRQIW